MDRKSSSVKFYLTHLSIDCMGFFLCVHVCFKRYRTISTHKLASYFEGPHLHLVLTGIAPSTKLYQLTSRRPPAVARSKGRHSTSQGFMLT